MKLGENIYHHRTQKGLSQNELAEVLQVSRQSVSKWETGTSVPELEKLMNMSDLFGITLDELVGKQPDRISNPALAPNPAASAPEMSTPVSSIPISRILGILLIALGGLAAILGIAAGSLTGGNLTLLTLAGLCGILCGVFCFSVPYPQLYCGWSIWAVYAIRLFVLTHRWEDQGLLIGLAGLSLIGMLIWTVCAHCSRRIRIPLWLGCLGSLLLLFLLILFFLNTGSVSYADPPVPVSPQ